ncbi:MAG: preprotein translocase subunit SecE [bacterium]|jgi:preprotein translocase subunit SecE|nr:preprotein translocase subunit SecE [bacterium]
MTTQVETSVSSGLDALKWLVVVVLLVGATLGNHYGVTVSPFLRVGGVVLLALLAFGIALTTAKGRGFLELLKEARVEARKIVWPTGQETWQTTLIVMVVVLVTSLLLWGIDSLFGRIISAIIS